MFKINQVPATNANFGAENKEVLVPRAKGKSALSMKLSAESIESPLRPLTRVDMYKMEKERENQNRRVRNYSKGNLSGVLKFDGTSKLDETSNSAIGKGVTMFEGKFSPDQAGGYISAMISNQKQLPQAGGRKSAKPKL